MKKLLIFDLDGLILNSLDLLSRAMINVCTSVLQNPEQKEEFEKFDFENPGISRFEKIDKVTQLSDINEDNRLKLKAYLLAKFNEESLIARRAAQIDEAIFLFSTLPKDRFKNILLTNCDNEQLENIVKHHKLHNVFGSDFFGTPPSKEFGFAQIINENSDCSKTFSISDSQSDLEIARANKSKFVWIKQFARPVNFGKDDPDLIFENLSEFYFLEVLKNL